MSTAEQILVIVLAAALALFLLLAIIATVKVIQILNQLKKLTEKAEKVVDTAEHMSEVFTKAAGPVAIGRLITNIADSVFNHKSKRGK